MRLGARWGLAALSIGLLFSSAAHAAKFSNQFVEFELPFNWKCILEGADWVCQSEDQNKKRDAIIVLAAKLKGDQDTLEKYDDYLKKPRNFAVAGGKAVVSQPKYTANKSLNGQLWVDSLHLESEIPGFFTRYLATVFQDIGVLVTYSVNKSKFQDYQKQFDDLIGSLKVFRKKGGLNAKDSNLFADNSKGIGNAGIFPNGADGTMPTAQAKKDNQAAGGGSTGSLGLIGLLVAAAVGFIIWKKKQSQG